MGHHIDTAGAQLPADLTAAIEQAGYYPALVCDVVEAALAGGAVVSHVVHQETTLDHDEPEADGAVATATSETIPLSAVRGVMLTHVVASPNSYRPGSLGRELTLTLGWGAVSRLDLVPASCGDPECDAEHGFEGTVSSDDISLRISADAEGDVALASALHFARTLSSAIGGTERRA